MAKRRDALTRTIERNARRLGTTAQKLQPIADGPRPAEIRFRGRRGVRARARQERILARQKNSTYRQPGSGSVSNSP